MTVAEALECLPLKGARVLTPDTNLATKLITWVSVIEVPVEDFIRPGEFVMSTGMNIGRNRRLLLQFVREVAERSPAALALAIGPYTPAVPPSVVREASRRNLVLIEIPWKVRFSEISEVILKHLVQEGAWSRSAEDFVWSLATGSITEEEAVARGRQYGYDGQLRYVSVLGRVKKEESPSAQSASDTVVRLLKSTCDNLAVKHRMKWLGTVGGNNVIGFLEETSGGTKQADAWLTAINKQLKGTCSISWGIGRICTSFADLHLSYEDAAVACQIGEATHGGGVITDVSDVLGDRLLLKLEQDADAALLTHRYLEPLRKSGRMQLLQTLAVYFDNDRNTSETARLLGISRQALLYRLNRAEALLQCDFSAASQRFAITLALRLAKLTSSLNLHS